MGADRFIKTTGQPVYRCWFNVPGHVASSIVHTTREDAAKEAVQIEKRQRAESRRLFGQRAKKVIVTPEQLPDPPRPTLPTHCDRCPVRCLWPGCKEPIHGCTHDMIWHQAFAHGMQHSIKRSLWDLMPSELWFLVADHVRLTNVYQIRAVLHMLSTAKTHPLFVRLRERVFDFVLRANAEYNRMPASVESLTVQNPRPRFVQGLVDRCRNPKAMLNYLRDSYPGTFLRAPGDSMSSGRVFRVSMSKSFRWDKWVVVETRQGTTGVFVKILEPDDDDDELSEMRTALLQMYWWFVVRILGAGEVKLVKKFGNQDKLRDVISLIEESIPPLFEDESLFL